MTDVTVPDLHHPRRSIRLDTILRLRWLAALGQLAAIFFVVQSLDFDLPVIPCVAIIAVSAVVTLALQMAFNPMRRLEPRFAAALLALNIAELAGLLYLTGGLENPFSFLFLGPVLISATGLPTRVTIGLGIFAAICSTALGFFHLPLPWIRDDSLVLPPVYMAGIWLSILVAIGVTSLYTFQVTEESRKLSNALAATELVLAREQHLTQLDGLAAAAAHELGTPLATIFLIARELERYLPFLATTKVLVAAVRKGVGREAAHEAIKEHAVAVALGMRERAAAVNDLYDRLAADPRLGLSRAEIGALVGDPAAFIGTAPAQVAAVAEAVAAVVAKHPAAAGYRPAPIL